MSQMSGRIHRATRSILLSEGIIMIRKILAPTDLSTLSKMGVRFALTTAKHFDAEVSISRHRRRRDLKMLIASGRALSSEARCLTCWKLTCTLTKSAWRSS